MSFLSVLKAIGHTIEGGVAAVQPFAPVLSAIPVAGPVITTVLGAITAAENLIPQAGQGQTKKGVVTSIVNAAVPGIDPAALSIAIDDIVNSLNAIEAAFGKLPANPPATGPVAVPKA